MERVKENENRLVEIYFFACAKIRVSNSQCNY